MEPRIQVASRNAEHVLARGGMLKSPRSSPFRVLARSCPGCGDLLITPPDIVRNKEASLPRCRRCIVRCSVNNIRERKKCDDEFRRKQRLRGDRNRKRANDELADLAHSTGKQWTGPELEMASRTDLTARQVAQMLGRTFYAVRHMRKKLRIDPRYINLAGVRIDLGPSS